MRIRRNPSAWLGLGAALVLAACAATPPGSGAAPSEVEAEPAPLAAAPSASTPTPAAEVEATDEAPQESHSNRIKWKTASELDNYGYDVYRAESPEGPFERINPKVIEGAGTTDEPTAYEYVDADIDPRREYYYYVESISMNGDRERFTPIGRAKPKIQDESSRAPEDGPA